MKVPETTAQGQVSCLLPVKLGYDRRAARDHTVSTSKRCSTENVFHGSFFVYFFLLTHRKPQAAQSLLPNPKGNRLCSLHSSNCFLRLMSSSTGISVTLQQQQQGAISSKWRGRDPSSSLAATAALNFGSAAIAVVWACRRAGAAPSAECSPSGCCSRRECGRPPAACPRR